MRINSAGNVGIGVTSPTARLHVQGAANDGLAIMGVGTTATRGFLGLDASNHGQMQVISSAAGGGALIKSIGNSYLNGGNVGIGTTSPVDKLDLFDANDNVGIYFHTATSGTGGGDGLRVGQNNANAFVWNYEATPLSLATGGTARLTINATGGIRFNTGYGAGTLAVSYTHLRCRRV